MNFLFDKVENTIPILFLHGWGGSILSFLGVSKQFNRSVILVDFPGHGDSNEPTEPMSVLDFAKEIKTLLELLNVSRVDIVAHSFGGRVAIKFASQFPDFVSKLVLCDSAGIRPKRGFFKKMRVFRYKIAKILVKMKIVDKKRLSKFGSDDFKRLSPVMKQTFVKIVCEDLSKDARLIKCPVLIVWGEKDIETPLFMAKRLNKLVPDSGLVVFKNAGHFAYVEQFARFVLILQDFLR